MRADYQAWKQMRAASRDQVRALSALWLPYWRPGAVGNTYVDLAESYGNIDVSKCSKGVKEHVKNAERINTEIGRCFASGMPDIKMILLQTPYGSAGVEIDASITSDRGRRIMELMRELAVSEKKLISELALDD